MVGLVDALAELRASQERATQAKAARAAAEHLATSRDNDRYFEAGHDDPDRSPRGGPARKSAGARVDEGLRLDQAARVDGGADALDRVPGGRVQLGPDAVEGCVEGAGRPTGPSATAGVGKHEAEVRVVVNGVQGLRQRRQQLSGTSTTGAGSSVGRGRTWQAITRGVVARPRPATPPQPGHWVAGVAECRGPTTCGQVKILDDQDELLAQALAGHPDWDAIWRTVEKPMRWAVRRILRRRSYGGANEDDVVHTAFEELMVKGFEGAPSLVARAQVVARRRALDLMHRRNPEPRADPCRFLGVESEDEVVVAEMLRDKAMWFTHSMAALAQLPDKQRYVVEQTVLKGGSGSALARELGVSHQAVSKLRNKGLDRLRQILAEDRPPDEKEAG
jgi:RNA polymerase sigma factor (sigma-70 family)